MRPHLCNQRHRLPANPSSRSQRQLLRAAVRERRQLKWLKTLANKSGMQHLSTKAPAFFVGRKSEQVILARLRLGNCALNLSQSRWLGAVEENCTCGDRESVRHFLLFCGKYTTERAQMLDTVRKVWKHEVNESVLLGGSGIRLSDYDWEVIARAVHVTRFVQSTGREL